jgi:hypothetical protein
MPQKIKPHTVTLLRVQEWGPNAQRKSNVNDDGQIAQAESSASLLKNYAACNHARNLCISWADLSRKID